MAQLRRVLVAQGLQSNGTEISRFVNLSEPASGDTAPFLLGNGTLQECNVFQPHFSSWLIDDSVLQEGALHLCTPLDPLFLFLPALQKSSAAANFCDAEQCLECLATADGGAHLAALIPPQQLECLCDSKEAGGQRYYRLNEEKAMAWLRLKVGLAKAALVAHASGFSDLDDMALAAYAAGIIGEYLTPEWSAKLGTSLGLSDLQAAAAAQEMPSYNPDVPSSQPEAKRLRLDPKEAAKAKAAESRAANKAAKLAKEASGMRKMSSFFTKK